MLPRFLFRPVLCVAPGVVTVVLVACGGRGPLDTDIAAYDAPDAAGLTVLGPGEGTEPKAEAGAKPMDAGASTKDAKAPTGPGIPGLSEDAGGIAGCFACAEDKCGTQVNACASSPACVAEGTCGLGCVTGLTGGTAAGGILAGGTLAGGTLAGGTVAGGTLAGGGTAGGGTTGAAGGLNLQCLMACDTDTQANAALFAALECTFTSCSSECLGALGGAGGGLGGLGGTLGGLGGGTLAGGGLAGIGPGGASPVAE